MEELVIARFLLAFLPLPTAWCVAWVSLHPCASDAVVPVLDRATALVRGTSAVVLKPGDLAALRRLGHPRG